MESKTIFQKLVDRELPSSVVWEDDSVFAFHDISKQAPVHVLIVPKKVIPRIAQASEQDALLLGQLLLTAQKVARQLGLEETGYRIVINNGADGGETVPHLHLHLLGGRPLSWPPVKNSSITSGLETSQ
ncbi:MAG: histidine triad nucleotide-binding protein [Blastochloris sp.]|nr:histidine triad nucleotide-binding protein [Blastochloris sp.]